MSLKCFLDSSSNLPVEADSLDQRYMRRCLELARQAEGRTSPNPVVGAVVLNKDGAVVGEGYHRKAGQPHAEVNALNQAGSASLGGTLYVNLEPCCHTGRTPPCSKRVIESGVARVVIGTEDSNIKVAGGGIAELKAAGIDVICGVLAAQSLYLNRGFFKAQKEKMPWVALKMAMTLDGSIADREGRSRYVSGVAARNFVMNLRDSFDCVLVGANTARLDDPALDVREISNASRPCRNPLRAVIDAKCQINPSAKIFSPQGDVIIFTLSGELTKQTLYPKNCKLVASPQDADGLIDLPFCLEYLLNQGAQKILCEGGGKLAGSLINHGFVDELYWIVAPKMLVDEEASRVVSSKQKRLIENTVNWRILAADLIGDDVLLHGISVCHQEYVI